MGTWTACTLVEGTPEEVLAALTDPEAARRWSPVPFEVELDGDRLASGVQARLAGTTAGVKVGFDVEVLKASDGRLALVADGPVGLEVVYEVAPTNGGSRLRASVSVQSSGGLRGRVLARTVEGLLAGGALDGAMARIAREVASLQRG